MNGFIMCQDIITLNALFSVRRPKYSNLSFQWLRNLIFLSPSKITQQSCWEGFSPSLPVTEKRVIPISLTLFNRLVIYTRVQKHELKSKIRRFLHLSWPMLTVLSNSSTARELYISSNVQILHIFTNWKHSLCSPCCNYHSVDEYKQTLYSL